MSLVRRVTVVQMVATKETDNGKRRMRTSIAVRGTWQELQMHSLQRNLSRCSMASFRKANVFTDPTIARRNRSTTGVQTQVEFPCCALLTIPSDNGNSPLLNPWPFEILHRDPEVDSTTRPIRALLPPCFARRGLVNLLLLLNRTGPATDETVSSFLYDVQRKVSGPFCLHSLP